MIIITSFIQYPHWLHHDSNEYAHRHKWFALKTHGNGFRSAGKLVDQSSHCIHEHARH